VGVSGVLLEVDQPLEVEPGTRVETEFTLPGRDQVLRAIGRVVREEPGTGKGRRRVAIEFIDLTSRVQDQIEAFVNAARQR
jgi:hypothetical protein